MQFESDIENNSCERKSVAIKINQPASERKKEIPYPVDILQKG